MVAGSTYELRYDIKFSRGTFSVLLGNRTSNFDFQGAGQTQRVTATYITKTRRFVAPVSTDFRLVMTVRNGDVSIDNVSIREVSE